VLSGASDAADSGVAGCDDRSGRDSDEIVLQSFMREDTTAPGDERLCQVADDTEAGNGVRAVSWVHLQPVQASWTSMWSISVSSNQAAA